mgnify:CR=1 FL=1
MGVGQETHDHRGERDADQVGGGRRGDGAGHGERVAAHVGPILDPDGLDPRGRCCSGRQTDRGALDTEHKQLLNELERIATQTTFNGNTVLNGTLGTLNSGYYLDKGYHSMIKIWGSSGWLEMRKHGAAVPLPTRPIHITTDADSKFVFVAFNRPSLLLVFAINADGTLERVDEYRVSVAVAGRLPDPIPDGRCSVDQLGTDATYKRMRQALERA